MMKLRNEQTVGYIDFPKKVRVYGKSDILVQFLAQSSISVYFETWDFEILFKFCMITGYQSTAKVN